MCRYLVLIFFLESLNYISYNNKIKTKTVVGWTHTRTKTTCDWCWNRLNSTAARTLGSSVSFSHITASKASSPGDFCGQTAATAPAFMHPFFKTQERQQGGEDRGISEGQQAGCHQVMTFKALVNLPFPGSAPSVCFLAVGTSVNELRGWVRRLKTTRSLSQLSSRQTSSSRCKNQNKPNPLQRFSKTLKTRSPYN